MIKNRLSKRIENIPSKIWLKINQIETLLPCVEVKKQLKKVERIGLGRTTRYKKI